MNYPLISEYVEAIKAAEDNFEKLKNLRPVQGDDGELVFSSGNFAVVFKMKDVQTGKLHAVKCFLKEQEGRADAYRMIAEELEYVSSTFLTPIKYLDKELFVDTNTSDETEFPVLLMDWVEGETLDKYIRQHIDDQCELSLLAYQFSRLAMWLMPQPFAHGDLKPDNILVKEEGTLVLVDYDGMYVPAMKGQKARELGSPDFRHPGRTEEVFDDHIDDFSLASILLSLKAIALQPSLLEEYGASDRLLFSEKDYRNLSESSALGALQQLMQDAELASLYSLYILALSQNNLSKVSFRLFNLSRPNRSQYEEENMSTDINEEEYEYDNCWHDEFKVEYSKDRKKLLYAGMIETDSYSIIPGTRVICDRAFEGCSLHSIQIPDSVIIIGESSFAVSELSPICLPSSIIEIGNDAFEESTISTIILNDGLKRIGEYAFGATNLISITIPKSVKKIGDFAFMECRKLVSVTFLNSNIKLGKEIFRDCKQLKSICVPYGTANTFINILPEYKDIIEEDNCENDSGVNGDYLNTEVAKEDLAKAWIGEYGVAYSANRKRLLRANSKIVSFSVRKGVKSICDRAFCGDIMQGGGNYTLLSITIPKSVISIGKAAFFGSKLKTIYIPDSICKIGQEALCNCNNLTSIVVGERNEHFDSRNNCNAIIGKDDNVLIAGCKTTIIPQGVKKIGCHAFALCNGLNSIFIPDGVVEIGEGAFCGCYNLSSVVIPDSVTHICDHAFSGCENLSEIVIPNSVEWIGMAAFARCKKLSNIVIPDSVVFLGNGAFEYCVSLQFVKLSNRLPIIGNMTFADCSLLKTITIPNGVTVIEGAFCNCKCLSSISIPNSVTSFGYNTFLNCYSLSEIIIPVGRGGKFEKLLPNYKDLLVEQLDEDEICLAYCSEYSRACEDKEYASWQPHSMIIKKNGKLGVVIDDGTTKKQIIPFKYDTWFDYDGYETEIKEDFFDNYQDYIGYFAIKNSDGTFTIHGYDRKGTLITSFICEKFDPDSYWLNDKVFLRHPADGVEYDDIKRMGYYYGQLGNNNCYFALRKGNRWSLVDSGLKKTYIDYVECDGYKEIGWAPKGYYAILIKGNKYQLCIGKKDGYPLILPNEYDFINMRYCMTNDGCNVEGLCFTIKKGDKWAVCSNDLLQLSPFIFDSIGYMVNSNCINVIKHINNRDCELIYNVNGSNAWNVKDVRTFNLEEIAAVKNAEVVPSQYGNSVCFFMKSGGQTYIPLYEKSSLTPGDTVNLKKAVLITLCREGEDDICRVLE